MSKTVFISRNQDDDDPLYSFLHENGFDVIAQSMITHSMVKYEQPFPATDWIFFSSRNAVNFFFSQKPIFDNQKIGAIGEATAIAIEAYTSCVFTGASSDTAVVAETFAQTIGNQRVLFPQSAQSIKAVQQSLHTSQIIELVCYETILSPVSIGFPDVLVFTSPSNVRAFFKANELKHYQQVVAFGKSTAHTLQQHCGAKAIIPTTLQTNDLLHAIKQAALS